MFMSALFALFAFPPKHILLSDRPFSHRLTKISTYNNHYIQELKIGQRRDCRMKYELLVYITFAVFLVLSVTVSMADLMEGLVAYWPLDDGSGGTVSDASGNGHDGVLESGVTWTNESKMGTGALSFDGVDDRIIVESFDVDGGSGITIAAWIKPNSFNLRKRTAQG